ncbi:MAG: hypothetical protein PF488_03070 [Patescibacteria group bacterium]|jgi:hypothetical protein|nr:hypothetical protein [Patescibacteria group bacterium]
MKKIKNKTSFFGLSKSERFKVVKQATDKAIEDHLELINRHGGLSELKNYSK